MVMNRNLQGIIAVAVFGGVAYLVYKWVKKGGIEKLLGGGNTTNAQKVYALEEGTPYYPYDKSKNTFNSTPKSFTKKGQLLGNFYGREMDAKISNASQIRAITVWQPDESGIIIDKTKVKIK